MKKIALILFSALFVTQCAFALESSSEKEVSDFVKSELKISDNLSVKELKEGISKSRVFLVEGEKKYVVKYIQDTPKSNEKEILNSQIASKGGYGPILYYCDISHGIYIAEYLPNQITTWDELRSDHSIIALAHLVKKIQSGPSFSYSYDVFKRIERQQTKLAPLRPFIPLDFLGKSLSSLKEALAPLLSPLAPSHNDLNVKNLKYSSPQWKAIDFSDSALNDPTFDLATLALHLDLSPTSEKLLLSTYLGHEPSEREETKLTLMKKVVLLKNTHNLLEKLSPEDLSAFASTERIPLNTIFKGFFESTFNIRDKSTQLQFVKSFIYELKTQASPTQ